MRVEWNEPIHLIINSLLMDRSLSITTLINLREICCKKFPVCRNCRLRWKIRAGQVLNLRVMLWLKWLCLRQVKIQGSFNKWTPWEISRNCHNMKIRRNRISKSITSLCCQVEKKRLLKPISKLSRMLICSVEYPHQNSKRSNWSNSTKTKTN